MDQNSPQPHGHPVGPPSPQYVYIPQPVSQKRDLIKDLNPTISLLVMATGLVVWAFNTFAQISYVKEQNQAIMTLVDKRYEENKQFSDRNRERMEALIGDLKDSIKRVEAIIESGRRR